MSAPSPGPPRCHYCGCRQIPLIRDYTAERERATLHADNALRALDHGDPAGAETHLEAMARELECHWRGEENGLFAIMRREPAYAEHISKEEDGLSPMSLVELSGAERDAAIAAWEQAHPGEALSEG